MASWLDEVYDFPIKKGRTPSSWQYEMVDFLVTHPRAFNLSDMGSRKTLSSLWAADILMRAQGGRALIVCPLSTMTDTWANEITTNFLSTRSYSIVHGADKESALEADVDFYIINHDGLSYGSKIERRGVVLSPLADQIRKRTDIRYIIYDEVTAVGNAQALRSKVAYAAFRNKPYLWAMTATPCSKTPLTAYGLGKLVHGSPGESFSRFRERVMEKDAWSEFKWSPRTNARELVYDFLQPAVRVKVTELPPECSTVERHVPLSTEQRKAMKALQKEAILLTDNGQTITAANAAILRGKLLQVTGGVVYDQNKVPIYLDCKERLALVREIVDSCEQKVLVFAPFTSTVHMVAHYLGEDTAVITGETSISDRDKIFRAFRESPSLRAIVAHPGTMSHGLNLTAASAIIWYTPTDKNEAYIQANGRIYRSGQEFFTTIYRIWSTSLDKSIYEGVDEGHGFQESILRLVQGDYNV